MAKRNVTIPGHRTPMVDPGGRLTPVWHRFLIDLHERTGGGSTDKVNTGATTAASAKSTAESADDRANFGFDFDLI